MRNYDLITPEGTKDLLFGECIIRRDIENTLLDLFKSRGYCEMITPGLEFFDVFNLNSQYFPQENLYKLTDSKGRLLVMRPDSTYRESCCNKTERRSPATKAVLQSACILDRACTQGQER